MAVMSLSRRSNTTNLRKIYMFYLWNPRFAVQGVDRRFWVTQDVFIVGYPFGLDTGFRRSKVNPSMSSTAPCRYPRGY